ncbi:MAG: DUF3124 domain-containing protein [Nonlabens sp.]|uniref:DUF3124 domain-containing protein n=1 Tax=Nonlabens sp. TaxID=1888209 RepID=UPI0032193A17
MKYSLIIICFLFLCSCEKKKKISSIHTENWSKRAAAINDVDSLVYGKSYLSVYSQIYSISGEKTQNLTAMVSLRNVSETDTIYVLKADYYDTHGKSIRRYFEHPIYLAPLETTEIIIDQLDIYGGTGSNFIFEWKIPQNAPEPLFEGIMTSILGINGLSFTREARRLE